MEEASHVSRWWIVSPPNIETGAELVFHQSVVSANEPVTPGDQLAIPFPHLARTVDASLSGSFPYLAFEARWGSGVLTVPRENLEGRTSRLSYYFELESAGVSTLSDAYDFLGTMGFRVTGERPVIIDSCWDLSVEPLPL